MVNNSQFFYYVTIQSPPYPDSELFVQLSAGVDFIGPDAKFAPRLFGCSKLEIAMTKAEELALSLDAQICVSGFSDEETKVLSAAFAAKNVKILEEA